MYAVCMLLCSCLLSSSAFETDWSDGPGLLQPTPLWNRGFQWSSGMEWQTDSILYPRPVIPDSFFLQVPASIKAFCIADLDSDGDPDIVAKFDSLPVWFENADGVGTTWLEHGFGIVLPQSYATTPTALAACDIDGDGDEDLAIAYGVDTDDRKDADYGYLYWIENPAVGGGAWEEHLVSQSVFVPSFLAAVDVDTDGSMDLVEAEGRTWYMGGGEWAGDHNTEWFDNLQTSWSYNTICGDEMSPAFADIESDGDPDLIYPYSHHVRCLINNLPSPFTVVTLANTIEEVGCVNAGDLNSDGLPDILVCGEQGDVRWFLNTGTPGDSWPHERVANEDQEVSRVLALDLDGDGDLDVAGVQSWYGSRPSPNEWRGKCWLNSDTFWLPLPVSGCSGYGIAHQGFLAGDIDLDGLPNLVFYQNPASRGISWFEEPVAGDSSCLESSILDLQSRASWEHGFVEWNWILPQGTFAGVRVRASCDPLDMGPWSGLLPNHCCLEGIVPDSAVFFQYRLEMGTESGTGIPILDDLSVSWGEFQVVQHPLMPLNLEVENPSRGRLSITVSGTFMDVDISVYDLSGRLVDLQGLSLGDQPVTFVVDDLPPGLYLCQALCDTTYRTAAGVLLP